MSNKGFTRVGDLLPVLLKSLGLEQRLKEREILSVWPTVVGDEIAARTEAVKIERGVLNVYVTHSAWLQELHFVEREIIQKLNERVPSAKLRRIRFGNVKKTS